MALNIAFAETLPDSGSAQSTTSASSKVVISGNSGPWIVIGSEKASPQPSPRSTDSWYSPLPNPPILVMPSAINVRPAETSYHLKRNPALPPTTAPSSSPFSGEQIVWSESTVILTTGGIIVRIMAVSSGKLVQPFSRFVTTIVYAPSGTPASPGSLSSNFLVPSGEGIEFNVSLPKYH